MQFRNIQSKRRGLIVAACLTGALIAQTALAACPPGYRSKAGHCIPGPAQTHHPVMIKSTAHAPTVVSPVHAKPHTFAPKTIDKSKVKPQPGVPIEHRASTSNTHGIIFVGGKQALNPQPIPPGHAVKKLPQPGAPIEKPLGH